MAKKKPKTVEQELEELNQALIEKHKRWLLYYEEGGSDPTWSDGMNMNMIRNQITSTRDRIKDLCETKDLTLPHSYSWKVPQEVSQNYMARPDDIRRKARATLARYEADPDYQYLLAHEHEWRVSEKDLEHICLQPVLHYVTGLRADIERDDLIHMRIHRNGDIFIDSFRQCAKKLKDLLSEAAAKVTSAPFEPVQLSLFPM